MGNVTFDQNQVQQLAQQNTFSTREVGVNHPDTPGYIRLTDQGDIQLMADDGLGIIINYKYRSITIMADTVRFQTTDNEGLAWNTNFFNPAATTFSQATLLPGTGANVKNVFDGTENYYSSGNNITNNVVPVPGASNVPTVQSQDLSQVKQQTSSDTGLNVPGIAPNKNSTPPPLANP